MNRKRIDEYHKNGCHFCGKLVVYPVLEAAGQDRQWGKFGAGVSLDYLEKAMKDAKERYGTFDVLLSLPELVIRIT